MKRIGLVMSWWMIAALALTACGLGSGGATAAPTTAPIGNTISNPTAAPPTAVPPTAPPTEPPQEPLVRFANEGENRNNMVVFDLRGYTGPTTGILVGWLTNDAGTAFRMGVVQAGAETPFVDGEGRDLFGLFSGALVTIEENAEAAEPGVISLQGSIPPSLLPALRQIAVQAATPNGTAFDPGLREQADVMKTHAGLSDEAAKANDTTGMRQHAEHTINIAVGQDSPQYGDLDGNGQTENPGDGYGVVEYANSLVNLLDQIIESPEGSERRKGLARQMRQCVVNVRGYANDAVGLTQSVLAAPDAASALALTDQAFQLTRHAHDGFDLNGNGEIEYIAQECGADQAYELCKPLTAIELRPAGG